MTSSLFLVHAAFCQKICLKPNCTVMRESHFDKLCQLRQIAVSWEIYRSKKQSLQPGVVTGLFNPLQITVLLPLRSNIRLTAPTDSLMKDFSNESLPQVIKPTDKDTGGTKLILRHIFAFLKSLCFRKQMGTKLHCSTLDKCLVG